MRLTSTRTRARAVSMCIQSTVTLPRIFSTSSWAMTRSCVSPITSRALACSARASEKAISPSLRPVSSPRSRAARISLASWISSSRIWTVLMALACYRAMAAFSRSENALAWVTLRLLCARTSPLISLRRASRARFFWSNSRISARKSSDRSKCPDSRCRRPA